MIYGIGTKIYTRQNFVVCCSTTAMPNEISIRTDKGEYVGGDTVFGSVYLCIREYVPSQSLKLYFKGSELAEFEYTFVEEEDENTFTPHIGKRVAKKDIIRAEIKLIERPGGFPEGCFMYPFMYQLPHNLPGVFHTKNDVDNGMAWEGAIKYSIGAILEIPAATPAQRVMGETPVVIYDNLDCRNTHIAPDVQKATGGVRTFFCIHRGNIHVSARLERSAYCPSDKITVNVELRNESAVDVTGFTVKLIRVIKLLGLDRSHGEEERTARTVLDTVLETDHDGCNKNNSTNCQVILDLGQFTEGIGIPPSTSGTIVKCSYVIDVDVHVPWAPDIEVRQSLMIKPLSNTAWAAWSPPTWVCECVQAPVTGLCAVPPNLLSSQCFSGIPGFQPVL